MPAQLVQRRVVTRVKRQDAALLVAHPQAATFEMPGYLFTVGVNEQAQCRWLTRRNPPQAVARVCAELNPVQK